MKIPDSSRPRRSAHGRRLRRARWWTTAFAGATVTATALSGCGAGGDGTDLRTVIADSISSFDPVLSQGGITFSVNYMLYDTLLRRADDGSLLPSLASEYEMKSATEYTFTIREGATCADGTAIDAQVVADSLTYLADPEVGSTWKNLVFGTGDATITADTATQTVNITLAEGFTTLPEGLAISQSGIVCPAGLEDKEGLAAGSVPGAFSGPYTIESQQPGVEYTLVPRDDYAAGPTYAEPLEGTIPSAVTFTVSSDESTNANQMISGDLDFAGFTQKDSLERLPAEEYTHTESAGGAMYLVFNERPGRPFADNPTARQAAARAIDREAYNNVYADGMGTIINSISPVDFSCAIDDPSLVEQYDMEAATEGLTGTSFTYMGNEASTALVDVADYMSTTWTDAGASVENMMVDNTTFWNTLATGEGDWDAAIVFDYNALGATSASLDRVLGTPVEDGGRNYIGPTSPNGDAALKEGLSATDQAAKCGAFATAQEILLQEDHIVPLILAPSTYITQPNVTFRMQGIYADFASLRVTE